MDHGESIHTAIAREMDEEVSLTGDFDFRIIYVDEPKLLGEHNFWQLRLVYEVKPQNMNFSSGEDSDEVAFMRPEIFQDSDLKAEQLIYQYSQL